MPEVTCQTTILKMGNKLGIFLKKKIISELRLQKGEIIEIEFSKDNKSFDYIGKLSRILTLKKEIISNLNLKAGEVIKIKIKRVNQAKRTKNLFYKGRIDLLSLIPEKTTNGFQVIVKKYTKSDERWLNIWCAHERGSCRQLHIKRFSNIDTFGRLLGLLQAEGTKNKFHIIEFANRSIFEHEEFITFLRAMGIEDGLLHISCAFCSEKKEEVREVRRLINDFERRTGTVLEKVYPRKSTKYGIAFYVRIRSVLLANVLLTAMDKIRTLLVADSWNKNVHNVANAFFAKLLSGDGNIDLDTKNRNIPQGRVKISDKNIGYLRDYEKIMRRFGFNPKLSKERINVRSSFNTSQAEFLLSIGAFKNNPNEEKLKSFISSRKLQSRRQVYRLKK